MISNVEAEKFRTSKKFSFFPLYGFIGVIVILLAEVALFFNVEIVGVYFTPIVWTGYILFVDALLYYYRGRSLIRSRPKEFLWMLPWSIICWLIFEGYNFHLENWTYIGLPTNVLARVVGYAWSFATIFPAVLLTAEFVEWKLPQLQFHFSFSPSKQFLFIFMFIGSAMLIVPLLVPKEIASKMFSLVWMGFVFLLDPMNYLKKRNSIINQLSQGNVTRLISLLIAGLLCGILWEFWNYWAIAQWVYSVPISIVGPKIFEMPLLGYLGFLPFAVECYVMYEFLYVLFPRLAQRI